MSGIRACVDGATYMNHYGLHDGKWELVGGACIGANQPPPTITPALVATAFHQIPLPALRSITQPTDKTLVNFETLFRVDAQPLDRTVTLLGQQVDLAIRPTSFRWVHGDGTTTTTTSPGRPYPAKDVVHRYQQAGATVNQHVEVTWSARWRLGGGDWADVPGTVTTVGPETALRVLEAAPALSGEGH